MKLQFKVQQYQTEAVDAVVNIFAGQPKHDGISYRIDPGHLKPTLAPQLFMANETPDSGLRNAEIRLTPSQLLENVHSVQRSRNLPLSSKSLALQRKLKPKATKFENFELELFDDGQVKITVGGHYSTVALQDLKDAVNQL